MKLRLRAFLIVMLLLAVAVAVQASIWPMYRYDTARKGRADDGALSGHDPVPVWVYPVPENPVDAVDNDFGARQDKDIQGRPLFDAQPPAAWTPADSTIAPNAYQGDFMWAQPNSGATATWSFPLADDPATLEITEGQKGELVAYYVYIWFPSHVYPEEPPHATNARYTVEILNDPYPNGSVASSHVFTVDQDSGGNWMVLSSSPFMVRDDQYVRVSLTSDGADGIVCADAVTLTQDLGSVLSSPAYTMGEDGLPQTPDDLVITCVTENRPLETVTVQVPVLDEYGSPIYENGELKTKPQIIQSGAKRVGVVYGVAAEDNPNTMAKDERGFPQWNFPLDGYNWVAGGFSSSPVVGDLGGRKVAYCPALDGQLYVLRTEGNTPLFSMPDSQRIVWQGPGYIDDAPSAPSWSVGYHPGFQGDDYLQTKAVSSGGSTATWNGITVNKKGEYSIYAWIPPSTTTRTPPSTTAEVYITDAKYTITVGAEAPVVVSVNQQISGGSWVLLGKYKTKADSLGVKVELSNVSAFLPAVGDMYVAADAIKVVPSHLGIFDWSSPAVSPDGTRVYIGSTSGRLYCFDVSNKANTDPVWVYPAAPDPDPAVPPDPATNPIGRIEASPTIVGSTIYIGSSDGHVYAVGTDGKEKWVYPSTTPDADGYIEVLGQISSTIAAFDGKLYFGVGSTSTLPPIAKGPDTAGRIIALKDNGSSATRVFIYPDPDPDNDPSTPEPEPGAMGSFLWSSPLMFDDNTMAIGSSDGSLIGLDVAGNPIWPGGFPDLGREIYSSPAGVQVTAAGMPMAFVGSQGGKLHGIDLRDGAKHWQYGLLGAVASSPAIAEGRIYVGDMSGITWAFSTRTTGGPGGGPEGWNTDISDEPPGDDESNASDIQSDVEVDIFRRAEFDAVKSGMEIPTSVIKDPDLHKYSRAQTDYLPAYEPPPRDHRQSFPYEWGETVYVIAWNCLDPNDPKLIDPEHQWVKGDPPGKLYVLETDSTLRLTIKSRGPGDQSDQSTALTMTEKGSFLDPKTGKVVFYAKGVYDLGGSSSANTQAPGSRITVSVQELPSTKTGSMNKGATAGDCVAPELDKNGKLPTKPNPVDPNLPPVYDHSKFKPQRISINNPLGLVYIDPNRMTVASYIGVSASGLDYETNRDINGTNHLISENGNHNDRPWVRGPSGDLVAHGMNSDERRIVAIDRSLLSLRGNRLSKFRVERNDLEWTGGPEQIWHVGGNPGGMSTKLPWEMEPPLFGPNTSLDYPDIRGRYVSLTMTESRLDPSLEETSLRPGGAVTVPDGAVPWAVYPTPMAEVISVPRFQPPNMPMPYNTSDTVLRTSGYTGRVYAFIDSNGDGRLTRPGSTGSSSLYQQSVTGAKAEAYREFNTQVHVPPDYRVEVGEKTFDIGAVPHGFGLTGGAALPGVFYPVLGNNAVVQQPGGATTPGYFDQWFKPFTAYNQGNVNLRNVQLARKIMQPNGDLYTADLFSDIAEGSVWYDGTDHTWKPYGSYIPAFAPWGANIPFVVCALDDRFLGDPNVGPIVSLPPTNTPSRTFHKSTVEEGMPTVLMLPDMPKYFPRTKIPQKPFFSVAVPMGTPTGTYSRTLTLFDDTNRNGIYEASESIGNPLMEAKVTVTENQLTDGYFPGALPQVDVPITGISIGDQSPAAYRDPYGNLQLFWSSNRFGPLNGGSGGAGDPWYLYKSSLPWIPPTQNLSGYWAMASPAPPAPANPQWWTPIARSYPKAYPKDKRDPMLYNLFNTYKDANNQLKVKPGVVQHNSVKFTSPSIAQDPLDGRAWLFSGGEAVRSVPATASVPETKAHEYRAFYWELDPNGNPIAEEPQWSTRDWTMPKYGVKGVATTIGSRRTLWTFWYGGNNSQWRIYFNMSPKTPQAGDLNYPTMFPVGHSDSWSNDGRLPLPKGLVSAAEPSIVPRTVIDENGLVTNVLDVVYSAYSEYHKNADIYLTRYEPDLGAVTSGVVGMDIMDLPRVANEVLVRDPASAIYSSKHVDWRRSGMEVWVNAPSYAAPLRLDVDLSAFPQYPEHQATRDQQTNTLIYTYNYPDDPLPTPVDPKLRATIDEMKKLKVLFRTVVIDPAAGTVKFLRDPGPQAVVTATYHPRAYRLTTDEAADTSPYALFDGGDNPRYRLYEVERDAAGGRLVPENFWFPSAWSGGAPAVDRLWVLWRRPSTVTKGTSIYYKSFRYTMPLLTARIVTNAGRHISFAKDPNDSSAPDQPAGPVEIDWAKNRLYFTGVDDGKTFQVTYTPAVGNQDVTEVQTVRLTEELDAHGSSFGNLTSEVANEGQVCAIRDTTDPFFGKLWVFWTSTRSGNTDLYYEAMCPRFYAKEFN